MKHALAIAALSVAAPSVAWAAPDPKPVLVKEEDNLTSIEGGRLRVGGGFEFIYNDVQKLQWSVSPTVEYFFWERFSLGGLIGYSSNGFSDLWSFGPSATYYYLKQERLALSVAGSLQYVHRSGAQGPSQNAMASTLKLGAEYFITPAISFGPALQWRHYFQDIQAEGPFTIRNHYSAVGMFSIYF